jgi:hypothetical protein
MNQTYTLNEAMDRLGLKSANALFKLERSYPDAFIVMKRAHGKDLHSRRNIQYNKATLDRFAEMREYFKQGKP